MILTKRGKADKPETQKPVPPPPRDLLKSKANGRGSMQRLGVPNLYRMPSRMKSMRRSGSSISRRESDLSVISVENRRRELDQIATATGIDNDLNNLGNEALDPKTLETLRKNYVRRLSLEILASTDASTRTEMQCDILLELLQDDTFFSDLSESVRRELCHVMGYKCLDPEQPVFRKGDEGDNFYIILTGCVAVYTNLTGEGMPLAELREGQSFGEVALANDAPRSATIITRDPSELLFISKNDYRAILRKLQAHEYSEKANCFKTLPHFRRLDKYSLMGLIKACKIVKIAPNTVVCKQGEEVSHIYIVMKGRCRLIKRINVPRIKTHVGESMTADWLADKAECFIEAEQLEEGSFFGESGILVLEKGEAQLLPESGQRESIISPGNQSDLDSISENMNSRKNNSTSSRGSQNHRSSTRSSRLLQIQTDGEHNAALAAANVANGAKRPRRPSQILKAAAPEFYPASLVTDRETKFLVVRLVDFLRCAHKNTGTETNKDELLQFASYRALTLHPRTIRAKLINQINWERKKRLVLLEAKIPKYVAAMQRASLYSPVQHETPFRC